MEENWYDILEISRYASPEIIKSSFRKLAKEYHPDVGGDSERYQKIRTAYEILTDQGLRQNYDQSLRDSVLKKKKDTIREKLHSIDICTKIEIILAYSTTRPAFRTSFASSCLNRMAEGKELTRKQIEGIDNVICGFEIDVDFWLNDDLRNAAVDKFMKKTTDNWKVFDAED